MRPLAILLVILAAAPAHAAAPPPRPRLPEAAEMLLGILSGRMGPGSAWFHPSESAYGWGWLAARMDADRDGAVTRKEFRGPPELFARLDRDRDGRITAADLDWSPRSPYLQQLRMAEMLLRRADGDRDGRLSAQEWQAIFKRMASTKDGLSAEDLRGLLFPPTPPPGRQPPPGAGMPSRWTLIKGLISGEIGSISEGPPVGGAAPEFRLSTPDGKRTIALSELRRDRPVVLIFGSFT